MPQPDSATSGSSGGRRFGWRVGVVLGLVLLVGSALLPGAGLTDHEPDHSGQCFAPTGTDPETDPLLDWTIAIDPGHGGEDPGAINGDLNESDLVLDISDRLRELLRASGAEVCQTRTADEFLSRAERAEFANRNGADLLVSIHLNSFDDPDVNYTMTMWQSGSDRRLADSVLGTLRDQLATTPEGEQPFQTDGRETQFNSGMLRDARMPAILVEAAFLSNPVEAAALTDGTGRREQIAAAVHDGIVVYVTENRPLLVQVTVPIASTAQRGMHSMRTWLHESATWGVRRLSTGYKATVGRGQLSLLGIERSEG